MKLLVISALFICMLPMFIWSCSSENETSNETSSASEKHEKIQEGGDDIYELEEKEQLEVILSEKSIYDSYGNVEKLSLYFVNQDGGVGSTDTIYVFSVEHPDEIYFSGLYKIWIQHIDQGSKGPFVSIMDSTIKFVQKLDSTHVYDFRID